MVRIAILASGNGSNAQRLVEHFKAHPRAQVALIGCDQPGAGVLQRAWDLGVPLYLFSGAQLRSGEVLRELQCQRIDLVVLAGFLRLIPTHLVEALPKRIINVHPALLPRFGGKGMYGMHVHQAVIAAKEAESGITIHYVNERFDEGEHIAVFTFQLEPDETVESLAGRIHRLEHAKFPEVVEAVAKGLRCQ
ncbi:MAG: phosphoribosylglycinamide formyltransferase [Flavobacteriales bacterium]|jgi:phosphoribosylglycinamide formyltransferase-1|nr:phosphoribosylglycinamide formyltransferase [Flavobacteriales bacterium]